MRTGFGHCSLGSWKRDEESVYSSADHDYLHSESTKQKQNAHKTGNAVMQWLMRCVR